MNKSSTEPTRKSLDADDLRPKRPLKHTRCSNLCHTWVQNMLWSTLTKRNAHNGPPDQRFLHVAFRDVIWNLEASGCGSDGKIVLGSKDYFLRDEFESYHVIYLS
jgi:hypothetical protein